MKNQPLEPRINPHLSKKLLARILLVMNSEFKMQVNLINYIFSNSPTLPYSHTVQVVSFKALNQTNRVKLAKRLANLIPKTFGKAECIINSSTPYHHVVTIIPKIK